MAFAFLLVSAGVGCCIYGAMLWRELPTYTEAEIEASAELNLALDLRREGRPTALASEGDLDHRRALSIAEIRDEIKDERSKTEAWVIGGLVLALLGALRGFFRVGE